MLLRVALKSKRVILQLVSGLIDLDLESLA